PNRDTTALYGNSRRLAHEGAPAGRQHLRPVPEQPLDHALFQRPELRLSIGDEQLRDRHARYFFDLVIAVDEGQAAKRSDLAPDHRLARPHDADEDNAPPTQPFQQMGSVDRFWLTRGLHRPGFDIKRHSASSGW